MNKTSKKMERIYHLYKGLTELGFNLDEIPKLLRISRQLKNWDTALCNGEVYVDHDTGKAFRVYGGEYGQQRVTVETSNKETQAKKRLAAIMESNPYLVAYHQSDPRGCSLYIMRVLDVKGKDIHEVYHRGIAVCI